MCTARQKSTRLPLLRDEPAQAVRALGRSPRDDRDRALLLLGFAGASRRSTLAGFDLNDVTFTAAGVALRIRASKEDPLGKGAVTEGEKNPRRAPSGPSNIG